MKNLLLLLLVCIQFSLFSQHRIAIYDVERGANSSAYFKDVSSYIVDMYAADERFIIIDKANSQLIQSEQDRQKSEEFIDGYIVEQGKQEGFDYCYYPKYYKKDKELSVKVYDVAKGTVISRQKVKVKSNIFGSPKDLKKAITQIVDRINTQCFELRYEIVRSTEEKKGKVKKLLFVVGYNQNVKEEDKYDIYKLVVETIGGKEFERKEVIGLGEIDEVQDGNFSILKVKKGGDVIYEALESGEKLYGSLANKQ